MMQSDHFPSLKRVGIYTKQSQSRPLGDTCSTQAQVDAWQASCAKHGYMLSEDQIYADVRGGILHAHTSERDQKSCFGSAFEIVDDAQNEQH